MKNDLNEVNYIVNIPRISNIKVKLCVWNNLDEVQFVR